MQLRRLLALRQQRIIVLTAHCLCPHALLQELVVDWMDCIVFKFGRWTRWGFAARGQGANTFHTFKLCYKVVFAALLESSATLLQ